MSLKEGLNNALLHLLNAFIILDMAMIESATEYFYD